MTSPVLLRRIVQLLSTSSHHPAPFFNIVAKFQEFARYSLLPLTFYNLRKFEEIRNIRNITNRLWEFYRNLYHHRRD